MIRETRYVIYAALIVAIVWLGLAGMAMAAEHETGTLLDFKPVVNDLLKLVFVVLSAFAAFAMKQWGSKTKILKDAGIRASFLVGIDFAISRAQAVTENYIKAKPMEVRVKNKILGLAGDLALSNYPKYSKYLKLDKKAIEGILERRFGELQQAATAGVAAPPADPSVGASNAAPGLPV